MILTVANELFIFLAPNRVKNKTNEKNYFKRRYKDLR